METFVLILLVVIVAALCIGVVVEGGASRTRDRTVARLQEQLQQIRGDLTGIERAVNRLQSQPVVALNPGLHRGIILGYDDDKGEGTVLFDGRMTTFPLTSFRCHGHDRHPLESEAALVSVADNELLFVQGLGEMLILDGSSLTDLVQEALPATSTTGERIKTQWDHLLRDA
jgi:hypothetical protein